METQHVCVCVFRRRKWRNKSREGKQQRKLLIILAPIRRNTASRYPRRRVMNASYCSPADIRRSSPPSPSPPPPSSLSHVPLVSCLLPSLAVLPLVHSGRDMRVTRSSSSYLPLSGFLLPFFFPLAPHVLHLNLFTLISHLCCEVPSRPLLPNHQFFRLLSWSLSLLTFLFLPSHDRRLTLSSSFKLAILPLPSACILHFRHFSCCLSFCSPTQLTHPC